MEMNTDYKNYIRPIRELSSKNNLVCYWVGGSIRDLILGRPTSDFDFALPENPRQMAEKAADFFEGSLFTLKEEREIFRVVLKNGVQFDFGKFKGDSIGQDLSLRDFSINSMAYDLQLGDTLQPEKLLDPFGGKKDLEGRLLRQVSAQAFPDDPLRMFRAFRIAAQLDFNIEPETLENIKRNAANINAVAAERVREELLLVLDCVHSYPWILKLDEAGLISVLFPEIDPNRECALEYYPGKGVWGHSLDGLFNLEWILEHVKDEFPENHEKVAQLLFQKEHWGGHPVSTFMKFAILFHDVGKASTAKILNGRMRFFQHEEVGAEIARKIGARIRLSSDQVHGIAKLVQQHMRPGGMAHAPLLSDKAKFRFFRDLGPLSIPMLLVSLADRYTYLGEEKGKGQDLHEKVSKELLRWHYDKELEHLAQKPKLVNGHVLMEKLGLAPGPKIGEILKEIEELTVLDQIQTPDQAIEFARHWLEKENT